MKPVRLKLRGYMTYKNEVELNFERLYDQQIFLITGDTGSGKSTIFDAIYYSLYNESIKNVNMDHIRSDFLNENDPITYVVFEFRKANRLYKIERIPKQRAKENNRVKNVGKKVFLYDYLENKNNWNLLAEKEKDVENLIKEIIGLDKNQFRKVCLLPQGEFAQFLLSNTSEKINILRRIFRIDDNKLLQDHLKLTVKEKNDQLELLKKELGILLSRDNLNDITPDLILNNKFNEIYSKIKKNLEQLNMDDKKTRINIDNTDKYIFNEDSKRKKIININEKINLYNEAYEKLEKLKSYSEEINSKNEFCSKAKFFIEINEFYENLSEIENNIKSTEENISELEHSYNIKKEKFNKFGDYDIFLQENYSKLNKLNQEELNINSRIKRLTEKLDMRNRFFDLEKDYKNYISNKEKYQKLTDKCNIRNREIGELNCYLLDLKDEKFNTIEIISNLEKRKKFLLDEIKLKEDKNNIEELIKKNTDKLTEFKQELLRIKEKKAKIKEKEKLEIINELKRLALKEKSCPVCGNTHLRGISLSNIKEDYQEEILDSEDILKERIVRTKTIIESKSEQLKSLHISNNEITLDDLRKVEKELSLLTKKSQELNRKINEVTEKLELRNLETDAIVADLKFLTEKMSENKYIEAEYNTLKAQLSELDDNLEKNIKLETRKYLTVKDDIKATQKKIEIFKNDYILIKEKLKLIENKLKDQKILYETKLKEQTSLQRKIDEKFIDSVYEKEDFIGFNVVKSELKKIEAELYDYFNDYSLNEKLLKKYDSYKNYQLEDITAYDVRIAKAQEHKQKYLEKSASVKTQLEQMKDLLTKVEVIDKTYDEESKKTYILSTLSDIANGQYAWVEENKNLTFETFVLIFSFENILEYANKRLLKMTDGQFLLRRLDNQSKRGKSGLDIGVLDLNTGTVRQVNTLSGGEMFLASLSLALGLSDQIVNNSSALNIECMFIDEGFGHLSENFIYNALNAIEKISQNNRLVGIISHVDILKNYINCKVIVSYDPKQGSKIGVNI